MLPDSKQVLLKYTNSKLEKLALFILKNCSTSTDTASLPVRVYDKRMCRSSTWVGIILRKAPDTGNIASDIMKSFNNSVPNSRELVRNEDIMTPQIIQGRVCTEITINGRLEQAIALCQKWNGKQARDNFLSCDIHPYSCMKRASKPDNFYRQINPLFREVYPDIFKNEKPEEEVTKEEQEHPITSTPNKREAKFIEKNGIQPITNERTN